MKKKIRIGLDFDGVIAYNPFRIIRTPVTYIKRRILGMHKLQFWIPKERWQQVFWIILHESSQFPAIGVGDIKRLSKEDRAEFHLITGRYSFLDHQLDRWLTRFKLSSYFKTINTNKKDEQPHLFKERMIKKYKLDYFVEDNLDIVKYLGVKREACLAGRQAESVKCKVYWIYNILDRGYEYPHKFPYLGKALEDIINIAKIKVQTSKPRLKLKEM